MRAVILRPYRGDGAQRDRLAAWTGARWAANHPDLAMYSASGPLEGPFNRAAALNEAARLADADGRWDLAVVIDADIFIDPANVVAALERAGSSGKVTWAFRRWNGLTAEATADLLAGGGLPSLGEPGTVTTEAIDKTNPISWSCCFVVPRAVWDDLGGFDERFRGWGWEDMAFQSVVCGLYGHERLDGDVYHLWHPRAEERIRKGTPLHPAYVANRMLGRRYMLALRMLGMHDRPVPSDPEEMERDRENIRRLARTEELDIAGNPRRGLPDWRDWWPSLAELRDAAKRGDAPGPRGRLAIVLRSGGSIESWPARRGYLEQALASLVEHVRYEPTVARIVYNDWPDAVRSELELIATAHGFYVVGAGNRGFTSAMRGLWRYLGSRSWGYDYAFVTEDDFVLERAVDVDAMIRVLAGQPHLLQMALLRDAFYQAERDAGGILGHPADEFEQRSDGAAAWLEHRRFFTLNPTLIRRSLVSAEWPTTRHSEAEFGRARFRASPAARSALWGRGETWVRHLGEVRAGSGY